MSDVIYMPSDSNKNSGIETQTVFSNNHFELIEVPKKEEEQIKERITYSQNWQAYDSAKTNEDVLFKRLLRELLFLAVVEEPSNKKGRRGYSKQDKLFSMCTKIYYKSDLRKTQSILKELKNLHLIEKAPCFKSIDNFFNDETLSLWLDKLILISALPLAELEETGAIDSTGVSTSQFERWHNYKWGKHKGKERTWRKVHACTGCKTNIFLSVKVTEKNVGDASVFQEVVGNRPKFFKMQDFVADKAYLSREILKFIQSLGLNPWIPFKKNSVGTSRGASIWRKMFTEFTKNKEHFMKKYHARSNVESNFHMLKQRFSKHCMTKTLIANTNEVKTKVLCHNLCVLIQEIYENDISIDFEECVKIANSV